MNFIHFFGTTGDKDIFFNNVRSCGGILLSIDDTNIIIDPGVNTFYKYISKYKNKIDGILLSHIHIDHSNDLNIFVELMTKGGKEKNGTVILPKQAVKNNILQPYLKQFPQNVFEIKPVTKYNIKNLDIITSIEHKHGVENYGFIIKNGKENIGIVTDTAYFSELLFSYKDCEILIINVPYNVINKPNPKHLDIKGVEEFIKFVKPKKVVLTHLGSNILENNLDKIIFDLNKKYNIDIIIAEDDMIFKL